MNPRVMFIGALALAAGVDTSAGAQRRTARRGSPEYRAQLDTTIAFDRGGTVTITSGAGDVSVTGVAGNQMHIRAVSDDDNIRLDVSGSRMALNVSSNRRGSSDARFELSVPVGVRVIARSQSGDITIHGTRGEVEAHAQSGDIRVDDVVGHLDIRTLSGDVTATGMTGDVDVASTAGDVKLADVRGNVEVATVSGDIQMRGVSAKTVRAKTTSGDVIYDGIVDPAGRYELGTHSGDVTLHIPRDASAQLAVSTWNGEIDSQFPITLKPGEHGIGASNAKRFTFEIGGGAARISAETFSGDVTVSSNGRGASDRRP